MIKSVAAKNDTDDRLHPVTPDGRYFVVKGRLWRTSNPNLTTEIRHALIRELMDARRLLKGRGDASDRSTARARVNDAKIALGERGPAWWSDGSPDYNRKMAKNTTYAAWFVELLGQVSIQD